jgi:hypothetical protein
VRAEVDAALILILHHQLGTMRTKTTNGTSPYPIGLRTDDRRGSKVTIAYFRRPNASLSRLPPMASPLASWHCDRLHLFQWTATSRQS